MFRTFCCSGFVVVFVYTSLYILPSAVSCGASPSGVVFLHLNKKNELIIWWRVLNSHCWTEIWFTDAILLTWSRCEVTGAARLWFSVGVKPSVTENDNVKPSQTTTSGCSTARRQLIRLQSSHRVSRFRNKRESQENQPAETRRGTTWDILCWSMGSFKQLENNQHEKVDTKNQIWEQQKCSYNPSLLH